MSPIITCEASSQFNFKNTEKEPLKSSSKNLLSIMYFSVLPGDELGFFKTVFPVKRHKWTSQSFDSKNGAEKGG